MKVTAIPDPRGSGPLGAPNRDAQDLSTDEALEVADNCPQRPDAKARLTIDRFDPCLAHERVLPGAVRLDPMSQEDPDRASLLPGQEVVRTLDSRIVPPQRPDSPAHARNRPASPLSD